MSPPIDRWSDSGTAAVGDLQKALQEKPSPLDATTLKNILGVLKEKHLDYRESLVFCDLLKKLPEKLLADLQYPARKVAVLADVNTQYLTRLLEFALLSRGIRAEVRDGDFGQMANVVLDAKSWLHEFRPDIVLLMSSTLATKSQAAEDMAETVRERLEVCRHITETFPADVVVTNWEPLPFHSGPGGSPTALTWANAELLHDLPERVFIFDLASLVAEAGINSWFDLRLWNLARQSFSLQQTPLLAQRLAAFVRAVVDPPVKLVVTDLDNTLWGGVVAENGLESLEIGGEGLGESYLHLQTLLKTFVGRGGMLAACSKNEPTTAQSPFARRPEMLLRLEDFVDFQASWFPKSFMLREILKNVNIGSEAVLFLDDSIQERRELRENFPEMIVPEWPPDGIIGLPAVLARRGDLARPRATREDKGRTAMLHSEGQRKSAARAMSSVEEFLRGLNLRAAIVPIREENLERVVQLLQKTNQFNLTSRRHSRANVQALIANKRAYARALYLEDRYGTYGLAALAIAVPEAKEALAIDTFLMSCRIMGKTAEYALFQHLLDYARAAGFSKLIGYYRPTKKNAPLASFYTDLGFAVGDEGTEEKKYHFDAHAKPKKTSPFIEVRDEL